MLARCEMHLWSNVKHFDLLLWPHVNCRKVLALLLITALNQQRLWISNLSHSAHNDTIAIIGKRFKGKHFQNCYLPPHLFPPLGIYPLLEKTHQFPEHSKHSTLTISSPPRIKSQQTAVVDSALKKINLFRVLFRGHTRSSWVPSCVQWCFPAFRSVFCIKSTEPLPELVEFPHILNQLCTGCNNESRFNALSRNVARCGGFFLIVSPLFCFWNPAIFCHGI